MKDSVHAFLYAQHKKHSLHVLDIGCGAGALMQELRIFGEVKRIDISDLAVQACRKPGLVHLV